MHTATKLISKYKNYNIDRHNKHLRNQMQQKSAATTPIRIIKTIYKKKHENSIKQARNAICMGILSKNRGKI